MGIEFELKYRATPEIQEDLARDGHWRSIAMETTYYDTPSKAMSSRFFTLRRRKENGVSVCTLKTPASGSSRNEWELECDSIETAIPELCKLSGLALLAELTAAGVKPVCGARFTRHACRVAPEGAEAEIALDAGVLFGGGRELAFAEVEAELKSGSEAAVVAWAQDLQRRFDLKPEPKSKFRRALDLAKGE